jgi:hypothetical protein
MAAPATGACWVERETIARLLWAVTEAISCGVQHPLDAPLLGKCVDIYALSQPVVTHDDARHSHLSEARLDHRPRGWSKCTNADS